MNILIMMNYYIVRSYVKVRPFAAVRFIVAKKLALKIGGSSPCVERIPA